MAAERQQAAVERLYKANKRGCVRPGGGGEVRFHAVARDTCATARHGARHDLKRARSAVELHLAAARACAAAGVGARHGHTAARRPVWGDGIGAEQHLLAVHAEPLAVGTRYGVCGGNATRRDLAAAAPSARHLLGRACALVRGQIANRPCPSAQRHRLTCGIARRAAQFEIANGVSSEAVRHKLFRHAVTAHRARLVAVEPGVDTTPAEAERVKEA